MQTERVATMCVVDTISGWKNVVAERVYDQGRIHDRGLRTAYDIQQILCSTRARSRAKAQNEFIYLLLASMHARRL